ncbi:MAG: hypothetical protein K6F84_04995, partial [Lachnospiraceae bacterium]|nr:hypothetical protein [Lachnospiraceae bacterium]
MKDKILPIVKIACFALICFLVFSKVYGILSWKETTGGYQSSAKQLYNTKDNLIDVAFVGSSHCYCGIFPCFLWRDHGMAAFDMATSGQDKQSSYYMTKELLKNQSPKVVCVDVYGLLFDRHTEVGNVYRNMLALKPSRNAIELIDSYVKKEDRQDFYLRFPIIHNRYKELTRYDFEEYPYNTYGRGEAVGNFKSRGVGFDPNVPLVTDEEPIGDEGEKWLEDMEELSKEKDFELVFFVTPFCITEDEQRKINWVKSYCEKRGLTIFDFNCMMDELGISPETDFNDELHLAASGTEKLTAYFGNWLKSNFDLYDHRGEPKYSIWDMDYQYYVQRNHEAALKNADSANMETYLGEALNYPNADIIISLDGDYSDKDSDLEFMGIPREEANEYSKWIYRDGGYEPVLKRE